MWALSNEPQLRGSPILAMMLTGGLTGVQGSSKEWAPGCDSFVPALAYHFCLTMSTKFSQTEATSFGDPCTTPPSCATQRTDRTIRGEGRVREIDFGPLVPIDLSLPQAVEGDVMQHLMMLPLLFI